MYGGRTVDAVVVGVLVCARAATIVAGGVIGVVVWRRNACGVVCCARGDEVAAAQRGAAQVVRAACVVLGMCRLVLPPGSAPRWRACGAAGIACAASWAGRVLGLRC